MGDPEQIARALRLLADRRMDEVLQAGELEGLAGAGKPLPDLDEPYDELWWVRKWLGREQTRDMPQSPGEARLDRFAAVETLRISRP